MSYPKLVALDTDWCIWERTLDDNQWAKGAGAKTPLEDNIWRVESDLLGDTTNKDYWIRVFKDVSNIIKDILSNGAKLAIVSRNTNKAMCDRALHYFNAINPKDNKPWSIIDLVTYDEIIDQPKTEHFKRIKGWSGFEYKEMILFDDENVNSVVQSELGVTFKLLQNNMGLTWQAYQDGLADWRRNQ